MIPNTANSEMKKKKKRMCTTIKKRLDKKETQ